MIAVGALSLLFSVAADPRTRWQKTEAWKYRNPEAAEPSAAVFRARRAAGAGVGVALILLGAAVNSVKWSNEPGRGKGHDAVERVAQLLGPTTPGIADQSSDPLPPMPHFHADLLDVVTGYADQVSRYDYRGADLKVTADRAVATTHLFTLTAAGGALYCLQIDETGPGIPDFVDSIKGVRPTVALYQVPIRSAVFDRACAATP
ncbi:hypothetical protein JMUB6875_75780 [Nocardia sp. JMUB6875]